MKKISEKGSILKVASGRDKDGTFVDCEVSSKGEIAIAKVRKEGEFKAFLKTCYDKEEAGRMSEDIWKRLNK